MEEDEGVSSNEVLVVVEEEAEVLLEGEVVVVALGEELKVVQTL